LERNCTDLHPRRSWPVVLLLPLVQAMDDAPYTGGARLAATARSGTLGISHIATLAKEPNGSVLTLHSWDGAQGAVFHMRYALQEDAGGLAYAGSCSQGEEPTLIQAPDMDLVYATQACLPPSFEPPANWTIVSTWDDWNRLRAMQWGRRHCSTRESRSSSMRWARWCTACAAAARPA